MIDSYILFIHGFNSSPQSMKAELAREYFAKHFAKLEFFCPQLASDPFKAINQLDAIMASKANANWYLIGSSLGGFFATYLAEKYQCQAVLVNPAVRPFELEAEIVGKQYNPYTDEHYEVTREQVRSLQTLECKSINTGAFFVMVQTGDEVLDYRKAVDKYRDCKLHVEQGGDHSFINFSSALPLITEFFNLS